MRRAWGVRLRVGREAPSLVQRRSRFSVTTGAPSGTEWSRRAVMNRGVVSRIQYRQLIPASRRYSLASLAGERFTVTLRDGSANPELASAAVTRSRASFTALLASPTIVQAGSPAATSTSTVTS